MALIELPELQEPIRFTILGAPRVKKNSGKVVNLGGRYVKINSDSYNNWENVAAIQLIQHFKNPKPIDYPINLCCKFFMDSRRKTDLSALYEGPQDLLVKLGILADDNYTIVASHDGSKAEVDKDNPRIEIIITPK